MPYPDPIAIDALAPTGPLRVVLNMGNPVLAHSRTASDKPAGVTIDLARRLGSLIERDVQFMQCESAGAAGLALAAGSADLGLHGGRPAARRDPALHRALRADRRLLRWCARDSPLQHDDEVDATGIRVVAGTGSAYGLFLGRHLKQAQLVQVPTSEEVVDKMLADPTLQVAAGVRQQLETDLQKHPGLRLLPGAFMVIQQAAAIPVARPRPARDLIERFMREQRASGFISESLERHGMRGVTVLGG